MMRFHLTNLPIHRSPVRVRMISHEFKIVFNLLLFWNVFYLTYLSSHAASEKMEHSYVAAIECIVAWRVCNLILCQILYFYKRLKQHLESFENLYTFLKICQTDALMQINPSIYPTVRNLWQNVINVNQIRKTFFDKNVVYATRW